MNVNKIINFVREIYSSGEFIPLHEPTFIGNENKYLQDTIESTFVSSVGEFVDKFENGVEAYTKTAKAVATVNGTAALTAALYSVGVSKNDLVITQSLTFVATCNAIHHLGAEPVLIDVSLETYGLCPQALGFWLEENAVIFGGNVIHKFTKQKIKAVVPMHTFGHPVDLDGILKVCADWNISLIEDAAESLGSFYKGMHTGTFGEYGVLSFNGNKIITTGGGGMILCGSSATGSRVKHLTTTAKVPHAYEFYHDEPGFNYRMPNLNAALGCAQLEVLDKLVKDKRELASNYRDFFSESDFIFLEEPKHAVSNFWLNGVICQDFRSRERLLRQTNSSGVMTRPVWKLMHQLPMYKDCLRGDLKNSEWLEARIVSLPSTPVVDKSI